MLSVPQPASAGLHQDYSRTAYFLIAPPDAAVEARVATADAPHSDATIYTLSALLPFRLFLFQLEFPYVSAVTADDILDGFGDPVFRLRFTAWSGSERSLYLLFAARMGSLPIVLSDQLLFPYASGSLDFGLGVAFADTIASVAWWLSVSATTPTRVEEPLGESGLHDDYSTATGGIRFPVSRYFDIQGGAVAVFPKGRSTRQIYFANVDWNYTPVAAFYSYVQVEAGPEETRAVDYSVGVGTKITF